MTALLDLLEILRSKETRISLQDGSLVLEGPKGALTEQELESIRTHKLSLVKVLQRTQGTIQRATLAQRSRIARIPLSHAQQRVWFVDQFNQLGAAYNIATALKLKGKLDRASLLKALDTLLERHDVLRTTFYLVDGEPFQKIGATAQFSLESIDLRMVSPEEREAQVRLHMQQEAGTPFDLYHGPLARGRLLSLNEEEHVLLVTLHHVAADGWSLEVMSREVGALYTAYCSGAASPLPPLPIQYVDYTVWERERLQGPLLQELMDYWRREFAGASGYLELLADGCPAVVPSRQGAVHRFHLSRDLSTALYATARENGATLFMLLLAAFQLLLARLSGRADIAVISPAAGRSSPETHSLIGCFVNVLILRAHVDDGLTFGDFLARVKDVVLGAYAHQELPFDKFVAELNSEHGRVARRYAVFSLEKPVHTQLRLLGLAVERLEHEELDVTNELGLYLEEAEDGLRARFEYVQSLFSPRAISTMALRFVRLLNQIVVQPHAALDCIDLTLPAIDALDISRATTTQQMMWSDEQSHPDQVQFNLHDTVTIRERVDPLIFEQAVQRLVNRTTALRLHFEVKSDGFLRQSVLSTRKISVPLVDFTIESEPVKAAQAWVDAARERLLHPARGAPFAYTLLKLSDDEFIWYRHHHHLIVDLMSLSLLTRRLTREYSALLKGNTRLRPSDTEAYLQYLHLDAEYRYSSTFIRDRRYWLAHSKSAVPVSLSVRASSLHAKGAIAARRTLDPETTQKLGHLAIDAKIGDSKLLIAAVALYLHKMTALPGLCIGVQTHGRVDEVTQGLVATCASILPVQSVAGDDESLIAFFINASCRIDDLMRHGRFHAEDIRRLTNMRPQDDGLFNIAVNIGPAREQPLFGVPRIETQPASFDEHYREQSLRIFMTHSGSDLTIVANAHLYEPWEIECHIQRLAKFLGSLANVQSLECKATELQALDPDELVRVTRQFNATDVPVAQECLIGELFEAQVSRTPHAIAVEHSGRALSYSELNNQANQLARYLCRQGAGPNCLVALCVERGIEMVVGLLGILKSGAAYVPLDPSYPTTRLGFMVKDSGATVLLTQEFLKSKLDGIAAVSLALDSEWSTVDVEDATNVPPAKIGLTSETLAYVIYTSGSTGEPKGAQVPYRGLMNLLHWYMEEFAFCTADRVLIVSSFSFDLTQKNFFAPLLRGGCLYFAAETFDPRHIVHQIERHQITTINLTPSTFYAIVEAERQEGITQALSHLRTVFLGGEPINCKRLRPFLQACSQVEIVNTYGPTECSDVAVFHRLKYDEAMSANPFIPIGQPIYNTQIYIADTQLRPVPIGIVGEIYIAGVGVGKGYVRREELTAERFIQNRFTPDRAERMYRTGDLGRWRADGSIEYFGRTDHQIKIRGFRVELGEIEAQLMRHPSVREAAVICRGEASDEMELIAYVTCTTPLPETAVLLESLTRVFPVHMLPRALIVLDELPRSSNGKLDRVSLAAREISAEIGCNYEPALGETEEAIARIWQSLLGCARVGRNDSFFELGGHSLLAVRAAAKMEEVLKLRVPVRSIFDHPTIARFTASLDRSVPHTQVHMPAARFARRPRGDHLSLSYAQESLWFIDQLQGGSVAYNMPAAFEVEGELDISALRNALYAIVERHEILRTHYGEVDGKPMQVIRSQVLVPLREVDLSHLEPALQENEARRLAKENVAQPFDLRSDVLLRMQVIKLGHERYQLLFNTHHIASDGGSIGIFIEELGQLYSAFRSGAASTLPELPIQYADYAQWQREHLQGPVLERQLSYWKERLRDLPILELPLDKPRPAQISVRGAVIRQVISQDLTRQIRELCEIQNVSLFMMLQTAFAVLLSRYANQTDVVMGTTVSGRLHEQLQKVIGLFVNPLVLRTHMSDGESFQVLLQRNREHILQAFEYQSIPFEMLVERLKPQRRPGHHPLFQVIFTLQDVKVGEILPEVRFSPLRSEHKTTKFDLDVSAEESYDGLLLGWTYCRDLFERSTLERLSANFEVLLQSIVANPETPVDCLNMLSEAELRQLHRGRLN